MAFGKIVHWIGTVVIFLSAILLLIPSISAPVFKNLAILKVNVHQIGSARNASITFGSFGYCVNDLVVDNTIHTNCIRGAIGYNLSQALESTLHISPSDSRLTAKPSPTNLLLLHPIAGGIALLASLSSCGTGIPASLIGSLLAGLAAMTSLVVMSIDFAIFGIVLNAVNNKGGLLHAEFSIGAWTTLSAMLSLTSGMILVFLTCCSRRREKRKKPNKAHVKKQEPVYARTGRWTWIPGY